MCKSLSKTSRRSTLSPLSDSVQSCVNQKTIQIQPAPISAMTDSLWKMEYVTPQLTTMPGLLKAWLTVSQASPVVEGIHACWWAAPEICTSIVSSIADITCSEAACTNYWPFGRTQNLSSTVCCAAHLRLLLGALPPGSEQSCTKTAFLFLQTIPLLTVPFTMTCHLPPLCWAGPQSSMWYLQMPESLSPNPLKTIQTSENTEMILCSDLVYNTVLQPRGPRFNPCYPIASEAKKSLWEKMSKTKSKLSCCQ